MTSPTTDQIDVDGSQPDLKRVMGPKLLLLFIVGDILGAGVYAVTGKIAGQVGGITWLPFLVAFAVATLTAFSYIELVTKYPQAAGAALYTHKAFGVHFVTFLVAFAVVSSGITSASTSSSLLAENLLIGLDELLPGIPTGSTASLVVALLFMLLLAAINLRGVGESVKFNVVLTIIEMTALAIVIGIGFVALGSEGGGSLDQVTVFENPDDKGLFVAVTIATAIAFFSMVGFEDSVNMVEEVKEPERIFPRMMLTGLGIAVLIYMLVAVSVVAVIPPGDIANPQNPEAGILLDVVRVGAPDLPIDKVFPFLTVFAVANTALINMLMASRLIYGMATQDVLPRSLGRVLPTPPVAVHRDRLHHRAGAGAHRRRADPVRQHRGQRPVGHHGPAAARRLHHRQRLLPGAAPRHRGAGLVPGADRGPGRRGARVRLPAGSLGASGGRHDPVQDRRRPARPRRAAVGAHLADQPRRALEEDRLP